MEDFVAFSQRQYDSLDYDPFHPVLAVLIRGLDEREAYWLSTLYMAYYNIGSAYTVFMNTSVLSDLPSLMLELPIGLQRRNLRGRKIEKYFRLFNEQVRKFGSIKAFLTSGFSGDEVKDWVVLQDTLNSIWGNGRWASYTLGELYQKVNGLPVLPTDIMNNNSSGPRAGLQLLMGRARSKGKQEVLAELDKKADLLFSAVQGRISTNIFYLPQNHFDYGMLESQVCDFNSLTKGLYYVGRDIDRMQERIARAEGVIKHLGISGSPTGVIWEVRKEVFDSRYLGELQGWEGRTKYAKTFYRKFGVVADHGEIREYLGIGKRQVTDLQRFVESND